MNLSRFSSAKKEHLRVSGASTECNRRTSGIGANNMEGFKFFAEKYPEACCSKCLAAYNRRLERKK
jgi:hypothetical protein